LTTFLLNEAADDDIMLFSRLRSSYVSSI